MSCEEGTAMIDDDLSTDTLVDDMTGGTLILSKQMDITAGICR